MALDEPKEDDEVLELEGFTLVAERKLIEEGGGLTVDYLTGPFRKGFQIQEKKNACGSCDSC